MTGLLDIHCHGAAGSSFGDTEEGSREAAAHHRESGVDTVVASLVSAAPDDLVAQVATLAPLVADGTVAGIHVEGPFLSPERRGAHDPAVLGDPDPALVDRLAEAVALAGVPDALRHMTFAPERPGAEQLVQALVEHGIRPAVGHTAADAALTTATLARIADLQGGPALVTHLFNGMPPMHHREGGPVTAALAAAGRGEAVLELIADGVHVAPEVVRMLFETVGPDAVALVSDAMAATGLGDGPYRLGSLDVVVADGTARESATGSIAGGTSTLADCVRWAVEVAGVDEEDALTAASTTPRRALGLGSSLLPPPAGFGPPTGPAGSEG